MPHPHDRPHRSAPAAPRPQGPDESRPIPPHGPVSPDGRHPWPRPTLASRLLVQAGIVLAVAGATAGTVMLLRRACDDSHDDAAPVERAAPARLAAVPPPPPRRRRRRRPALRLGDITGAVGEASRFLDAALAGFRLVAAQAGDRMQAPAAPVSDPPAREGAAGPRGSFRRAGPGTQPDTTRP